MLLDEPVIFVSANFRLNGAFSNQPISFALLTRKNIVFGFLPGKEVLDAGFQNAGFRDRQSFVVCFLYY